MANELRFNSFSGADIIASFAGIQIGEIQGVSVSISREKAPIYTMGSVNPRAFSRGKRGIAGSLVFIVFDKHALLSAIETLDNFKFAADDAEFRSVNFNDGRIVVGPPQTDDSIFNPATPVNAGLWTPAKPFYADQIPPFDIVIFGGNEHGNTGKMTIHGVEILNEGMGLSIDDIVTEQQMTFVAREITPWTKQESILTK